mmetsp:Transcript_53679/g.98809  ORF Transcript_53679/g.98809 Transcript_53679/m.98809 type:complete len:255 (+) Transcript_53679:80-844(+)
MICFPATQFCCGCSLSFGVKAILMSHLFVNVTICLGCILHLIFGNASLSFYSTDLEIETAELFYGLAGLPIIILALHGAWYRDETKVRVYFIYMLLSMAFVVFKIFKEIVFSGICGEMAGLMAESGSAWACGVARYAQIMTVSVSLGLMGYVTFVVNSFCQDLAEGAEGPDLFDLTWNKNPIIEPHHFHGLNVESKVMLFSGEFNTVDSVCTQGLGGSVPLFGKSFQEVRFPPVHLPGKVNSGLFSTWVSQVTG